MDERDFLREHIIVEELQNQLPRNENIGMDPAEKSRTLTKRRSHNNESNGTKVDCSDSTSSIASTSHAPTVGTVNAPITTTSTNLPIDPLDNFLGTSTILSAAAKQRVRLFRQTQTLDKEPLRHIRFSDVIRPPDFQKTITTAYTEATVVDHAPWFPHREDCTATCCAKPVAISLQQDDHRIINSLDGIDVADVHLHATKMRSHQVFAASDLTADMLPCLRSGVIIHADNYGGPIYRMFIEHRPNITVPYVLLTTKADGPTPFKIFKAALDSDPLLLAWYGINPSYENGAEHKKIRMMPLGLAGGSGLYQQPNLNVLMQARNYTNPFGGNKSHWTNATLWQNVIDTTSTMFVNFGIHSHAKSRGKVFQMACDNRTATPLDNISCNKTAKVEPEISYAASSKYLFGLSPPGNGKDCYRTYELLLNGLIPIVLKQPEYDALFKDLPVLQLPHWDYTQQELVQLMKDYVYSPAFLDTTFDAGWKRMFMKHWRHQVLKDAGRLDEITKDPQGNEYYTAWKYTKRVDPYVQGRPPIDLSKIKL